MRAYPDITSTHPKMPIQVITYRAPDAYNDDNNDHNDADDADDAELPSLEEVVEGDDVEDDDGGRGRDGGHDHDMLTRIN